MEGAKKTKQMSFASLCALASLREMVYFFTASDAMGHDLSSVTRAGAKSRGRTEQLRATLATPGIQFPKCAAIRFGIESGAAARALRGTGIGRAEEVAMHFADN